MAAGKLLYSKHFSLHKWLPDTGSYYITYSVKTLFWRTISNSRELPTICYIKAQIAGLISSRSETTAESLTPFECWVLKLATSTDYVWPRESRSYSKHWPFKWLDTVVTYISFSVKTLLHRTISNFRERSSSICYIAQTLLFLIAIRDDREILNPITVWYLHHNSTESPAKLLDP
jgi:hypothetical protein